MGSRGYERAKIHDTRVSRLGEVSYLISFPAIALPNGWYRSDALIPDDIASDLALNRGGDEYANFERNLIDNPFGGVAHSSPIRRENSFEHRNHNIG